MDLFFPCYSPEISSTISGDIESHFSVWVMESQLLVFRDGSEVVQMFLSAENEALVEMVIHTLAYFIKKYCP